MAREKSAMELFDILSRLRHGHSNKRIHRDTGTHRTVIRKLRSIAEANGWLNANVEMPVEKEIYNAYHNITEQPTTSHPLESFREDLKRYKDEGYTYVVMHELIKDRYSCSESTVRRFVQNHIEDNHPRTGVIRDRELSVMEVDFGHLGILYDDCERRNRKAYVFSGRLRYSAKAYRKVVFDQKQETFWQCHMEAFERFGGVPERVVPDNLKAAVVKASFTDPEVNRGYRELALHYGFLIDPCLPYHPEHKGGVENDIKYIKRNFWPVFKERQGQKGRAVPLGRDSQEALRCWEEETADIRIIKNIGASPNELFDYECSKLSPLKTERFDIPVWKNGTVSSAARITFDRCTYTVPEKNIGKNVIIAANRHKIRIFHNNELITEHNRSYEPYGDIERPEHRSARADAYLNYTRQNLLKQARQIGTHAYAVIEHILSDKAVSGNSPAWGIVTLGKKFGFDRLEKACARALLYEAVNYKSVKRILEHKLDLQDDEKPVDSHGQRSFTFARAAGFFNKSKI
ncbi:MAG: IS21 family transposase [bacterium]|nr:IS21 family transposase [bacterium]